MLRKMGSGRTGGSVVGDVWRKGHSSVGAMLYETEAQRLMLFSESNKPTPDRLTALRLSYLKTVVPDHTSI